MFNDTHAAANVLLLTMLTGQLSFNDGSRKSDTCNTYFFGLGYVLAAVTCCGVCLLLDSVYTSCWKRGVLCTTCRRGSEPRLMHDDAVAVAVAVAVDQ